MTVFLERGPRALIEDYAAIARINGPDAVRGKALRSRSPDFQELFAHLATYGELTLADILVGVKPKQWHKNWRYVLARTIAHQEREPNAYRHAERLLSDSLREFPKYIHRDILRLLAEIRHDLGDFEGVKDLLDRYEHLAAIAYDPVGLSLLNPAVGSPYADYQEWLSALGAGFEAYGLQPLKFSSPSSTNYSDLITDSSLVRTVSGPLVSVIVTVYKPDLTLLAHSIQSLLHQTWGNLEIIVVDDASGPEYDDVLTSVSMLDPRSKLIRQSVNQGTYAARNRGFQESTGDFVTGHDSDDWSHPQRIARQIQPLLENESIPGSMTFCLKVDEKMNLIRLGQNHFGKCQSTLLLRREARERFGDFLPARKAVDSEYMIRVDTFSEVPLAVIEEPLEIVLTDDNSLSGGDFAPGWRHPARSVIRESYTYRHEQAKSAADPIDFLRQNLPVIPPTYQIAKPGIRHYDVVFAGDWQSFGGPQKSMLQEIRAQLGTGRKVAVMDVEVDRMMRKVRKGLNPAILDLLHDGVVDFIFPDQEATADTLILRYPPALQFTRRERFQVEAKNFAILANQAPSERDGTDIRYYPQDVHRNATFSFGKEPLWIPQGPVVRSQLQGVIPDHFICDIDFPSVVQPEDWRVDRTHFRSSVPVIGRHSRDDSMKWPGTAKEILDAYPVGPEYQVRVMGGTGAVTKVLEDVPTAWQSFVRDQMPVPEFLAGLDFYVFFPHRKSFESFGTAILEALASGLVVLLPPQFEETFGDAAIYCEPADVTAIVDEMYADQERYLEQSAKALRAVEKNFSLESYLRRFAKVFGR